MSVQIQTVIDQKAFLDSVQKGINMANKRLQSSASKLKLNIDDKGFRQPLGRITGDLKMFDSALAASNARVIAFGASTAVIGSISRAFRDLAKSTVEVEKAFTDINRILNLSTKQFSQFGNQLFDIGKKNSAAFGDLTKAALEFSRQGLSTNEVLKRTSDALTLVRLTGINAEKAVSSLTATVNAFDGSMLTTTEALNKFVAVETKFAVGARDLVEALGRVGSSAQDAKVGFDELNAIVTSVQQTTGRGGAVIGNAMKTIFTRLQRQDTLEALEAYGVAVRDVEGQTLPAIRILQSFAKQYSTLADSSQSYLREQVAGVFQGNILSAVLKDLTKQTSTYSKALDISRGASDEAAVATAKLNQTLSSLTAQTALEFKRLQENLGKSIFEPTAKALLTPLMDVLKGINNVIDGEGAGSELANNILKGFGNVIAGPGLTAALALIGKIFINTTGYILKSLPALAGITTETQKRANIEEFIQSVMASEASIAQSLLGYEGDIAQQAKILAGYAEMTAQDMERQQRAVTSIATQMAKMPSTVGAVNVAMGGKRGRAAGGFIPGITGEVHDIKRGVGGVSPSSKPVVIPNFAFGGGVRGTMIANTGEYIVPNYSNGGSAIFNPNMVAQYGMPSGARPIRGASGYVPNFAGGDANKLQTELSDFARMSNAQIKDRGLTNKYLETLRYAGLTRTPSTVFNLSPSKQVGLAKERMAAYQAKVGTMEDARNFATMLIPQKGVSREHAYGFSSKDNIKQYSAMLGRQVQGVVFNIRGISPDIKGKLSSMVNIEQILDESIIQAANTVISKIHPALAKKSPITDAELDPFLNKEGAAGAKGSLKGAFFEALIGRIVADKNRTPDGITLDTLMTPAVKRLFVGGKNIKEPFGDFKSADSEGNRSKFVDQILKNRKTVDTRMRKDKNYLSSLAASKSGRRAAAGYIPNFAALGDAVEREVAAGVPLSSIRVNRSSSLVTPNNPAGLAVTNRRDEPNGLADVVRAAAGYIPNFAKGGLEGIAGDIAVFSHKGLSVAQKSLSDFAGATQAMTKIMIEGMDEARAKNIEEGKLVQFLRLRALEEIKQSANLKELGITEDQLQIAMQRQITELNASNPAAGGMGMMDKRAMAGMAVGMGLSFGLPMLGGFTENKTAQSGLTAAGTGAGLGMMFGPEGAAIGALLGGAIGLVYGKSQEAARALEDLAKSADDYNKESQQTIGAAQQYINAMEEAASATTESELIAAQKRVKEQFDRIKGTALEDTFLKAGTNVKELTDSLGKYEKERARASAIQALGLSAGEFKYLDAPTAKLNYAPSSPGAAPSQAEINRVVRSQFGEKTQLDALRRFRGLTEIFQLEDFDPKELKAAVSSGADSLANYLYEVSKRVEAADPTRNTLQSISEAKTILTGLDDTELSNIFGLDFLKRLFDKERAARDAFIEAQEAQLKEVQEAIRTYASVRKYVSDVSMQFEKIIAANDRLNTIEATYIGERINTLNSLNMGLEAASEARILAENKNTRAIENLDKSFFKDNSQKFVKLFQDSGLKSTDSIEKMTNAFEAYAKDPAKGLDELYNIGNLLNADEVEEYNRTIQSLIIAYDTQKQTLETQKQINQFQADIQLKRAKNTELERRLTYEQNLMLEKRSQVFSNEELARNKQLADLKFSLENPNTYRGQTRTTSILTRQGLENQISRKQFEIQKAEKLEEFKQRAIELMSRESLIKSNYDLISTESQLINAVEILGLQMQKFGLSDTTNDLQAELGRAQVNFRRASDDPNSTEFQKYEAADNLSAAEINLRIAQEDLNKKYAAIDEQIANQRNAMSAGRGIESADYASIGKRSADLYRELENSMSNISTKEELIVALDEKILSLKGNQNRILRDDLTLFKQRIESGYIEIENAQQLLEYTKAMNDELALQEDKQAKSFTFQMGEGFREIFQDLEYIDGKLGRDLPMKFKDGMVNAMEAVLDKTESVEDALKGVAVEMLKTIRRATLETAMGSLTSLIGLGVNKGFRQTTALSGFGANQTGGIIRANNGMYVSGNRTGDRNPALLEDGEYVLNKKAVRAMGGKAALDQLNFAVAPRFADGGLFGVNESINSPRMSGFYLSSMNPELQKARSDAEEKEQRRLEKRAEKEAFKKQVISTLISTAASTAISMGSQAVAGKMQQNAAAQDTADMMNNATPSAAGATPRYEAKGSTVIDTQTGQPVGDQQIASMVGQQNMNSYQFASSGLTATPAMNKEAQGYGYQSFEDMRQAADPRFGNIQTGAEMPANIKSYLTNLVNKRMEPYYESVGFNSKSAPQYLKNEAFNNFMNMHGQVHQQEGVRAHQMNKFATGGFISYGMQNKDTIPAFLAGGEYIMNNKAVKKYGLGFMGRLNGGLIPKMQSGGSVGGGSEAPLNPQSNANTNNISINVTVNENGSTNSSENSQGGSNNNSSEDKKTESKNLADRIRGVVIQVIQEEQRVGGSLSKSARKQ